MSYDDVDNKRGVYLENKTTKHWIVLLVACGFAASSMGINLNIMGVFYQPMAQDLDILVGSVAFNTTLAAMFIPIVSLFVNRILSFITFKQMTVAGILISAISTALMAFVSSTTLFNILGIIRGIGSGCIGVVTFTMLINNWFEEKNGLALSITSSFAGIVGVILSPVLTWTIATFGWRLSYIILSSMFLIFNLPLLFIPIRLNPRDEGLLPYGFEAAEIPDEVDEEVTFTKKQKVNYKGLPFISLSIIALFYSFASGISQTLPGFSLEVGYSLDFGATLLSACMLANIVFKLVMGSWSGSIGVVKATYVTSFVLIGAMLMLIYGQGQWLLISGAFLYGINYFVPAIALPLLTREFFGREKANRVYPILALFAGFGAAYSVTIIGYIYDFLGTFMISNWLVVILTAISVVLLAMNKTKKQKAVTR